MARHFDIRWEKSHTALKNPKTHHIYTILANLALYGRLLIKEATWQVGGYGFGQVLTKHIIFSEYTARSAVGYGTM